MLGQFRKSGIVLALLGACAGCVAVDPGPPVVLFTGHSASVTGIQVLLCANESVTDVSVYKDVGDGVIKYGPLLWQISSSQPVREDRFAIGSAPPSYATVVPLTTDISRLRLDIRISTTSDPKGFVAPADPYLLPKDATILWGVEATSGHRAAALLAHCGESSQMP
jgi:hypothetical protein